MATKGDSSQKLLEAVMADDADTVRALISAGGIKVNKQVDGLPPLLVAAVHGAMRAAQALLDAGADINVRSGSDDEGDRGLTALMLAAECGNMAMIDFLLARGADPKILTKQGRSAINLTLETSHEGDTAALVKRLLEAGSPASGSCLGRVTEHLNAPIARMLIRAGADPNAPATRQSSNWPGATPLAFAIYARQMAEMGREIQKALGRPERTEHEKAEAMEVARELVSAGADVNLDNKLYTPLVLAARSNDVEMVKFLLANGADVNKPSQGSSAKYYQTALHACAFEKLPEMARLLLDAGANIEATDALGRTPLQLARQLGHDQMVELFRQAGARDLPIAPPPLRPERKTAKAAAPATPKRSKADTGGAKEFLRMVFDGNPEWAIFMVRAGIDDVGAALGKARKVKSWQKNVPVRKQVLTGGAPLDELAVVQLADSDWTIIIRRLWEIDSLDLSETPADARALSKRLRTCTATFMGEDTSSAMGFELFENGKSLETIQWCGGMVTRFESALRDRPDNWPSEDFDIADAIFADLGVRLPCCFPDASDADEPYLAADAASARRIRRADVITI